MQINDETHEMEILTGVLKRLEANESGAEAEKINELIKVNKSFCDRDNAIILNFFLLLLFFN